MLEMKLQQDITQAKHYLALLDDANKSYTFQTFDDSPNSKKPSLARIINGTIDEVFPTLCKLNNQGAGIFVTVNETDGAGRKKENIVRIRSTFIEDDSKAGVSREDFPIRPNMIVNSSQGNYHHYFLTSDMALEQFTPIQNRFIASYQSDASVKDISRVLRLPSFYHMKGSPHLVSLVEDDNLIEPYIYTVSELEAAFPPIAETSTATALPSLASGSDLVLSAISEAELYIEPKRNERGAHYIQCPWADTHTSDSGKTQTTFYQKNSGGFSGYGFKCMHSHCADKTGKDLVDHLGVSIDVAVDKAKAAVNDISSLQKAIARAESRAELVSEIIPLILRAKLEPLEIGLLETPIQLKIQSLEGSRPKIKDVRQLLNPIRTYEGGSAVRVIPEWAQKWAYVSAFQRYIRLDTLQMYDRTSFDLINGIKIPASDDASKPPASVFVRDEALIESCDNLMYLPWDLDRVTWCGNARVVNTYDHNSVPVASDELKNKDYQLFIDHFVRLLGSQKDADILIDWLAHNVQRPGRLILWAPIFIGEEGIGKSIISRLLSCVLGHQNVTTLSTSLITSPFNSWALGSCVGVIEELRIRGQNRHEVLNNLKPLITNKSIAMNIKNVSSYTAQNSMNYIAFSNFRDSIPFSSSDRRWWVIFARPLEELLGGLSPAQYFDPLYDLIENSPRDLRLWLEQHQISEEFKKSKGAPASIFKDLARATEQSVNGSEGHDEALDILDKGIPGISKLVFCSRLMRDKLLEDVDIFRFKAPSNKQVNQLYKELGYIQLDKPMRIMGQTHRIWMKNVMSVDEIRNELIKKSVETA